MRILLLLCLAVPAPGADVQQYVVGGSDANIADHPHQLSLRMNGDHACGASLISSTRAVTAAQCGGSGLSIYTLLGGTSDRRNLLCATCVLTPILSMTRHPQWIPNGYGFPNDVAVIGFLPVLLNSNLSPIVMANASSGDFAGQSCIITGWGRTAATGGLPVILQQATMTVMTNADCANSWDPNAINNGHICVTNPSSGACSGDIGGPLVCGGELAGAASWGNGQCNPSFPSVYTRISYFYDWITTQ